MKYNRNPFAQFSVNQLQKLIDFKIMLMSNKMYIGQKKGNLYILYKLITKKLY